MGFFVEGVPAPKGSFRVFVRGGRPIVRKDSDRTYEWEDAVACAARVAVRGRPPLTGPVRVRLLFVLQRPASHMTSSGALRKGKPVYPQVKPDLDKLERSTWDALAGIAYRDDAQVVASRSAKVYAPPGGRLGVCVRVEPVVSLEDECGLLRQAGG